MYVGGSVPACCRGRLLLSAARPRPCLLAPASSGWVRDMASFGVVRRLLRLQMCGGRYIGGPAHCRCGTRRSLMSSAPLGGDDGGGDESGSKFDPVKALHDTPKTAEGATALYDSWASQYDQTLHEWGYVAHIVAAELFTKLCHSDTTGEHRAALPVLDCGCGTGLVTAALADCGFAKLAGVDISQESLDLLQLKVPQLQQRADKSNIRAGRAQQPLELELRRCDLNHRALPFGDAQFGGLVCVGVLSYIDRFDHAFAEMCRATQAGGICVFTVNDFPPLPLVLVCFRNTCYSA
jgi:ubiquinone/menaquinone biosynthesis C-methylase UbiE